MTFVITQPCVDLKDGSCVPACPVDCIYTGGRMLYIHPTECIACGLCETVCPVDAIVNEYDLEPEGEPWIAINAEFFDEGASGYGSPGGANGVEPSGADHPLVAKLPAPSSG